MPQSLSNVLTHFFWQLGYEAFSVGWSQKETLLP